MFYYYDIRLAPAILGCHIDIYVFLNEIKTKRSQAHRVSGCRGLYLSMDLIYLMKAQFMTRRSSLD